MKRMLTTLAVLLLLLGVCGATASLFLSRYLDSPLEIPPGGTLFEVPAGASFATIAGDLEARRLARHPEILRLYARWTGQASKVQAGEYRLESGATPRSLLQQFTRGAVVEHAFTFVEGWNHRELLAALQAHRRS